MTKINREEVHKKLNGHCGYCGKEITIKEMQVDHVIPKWKKIQSFHNLEKINDFANLMPSCRRCNHYKRGDGLEEFRKKMITLHERIEKEYINKVAIDFGIINLTPFDGVFYFEKYEIACIVFHIYLYDKINKKCLITIKNILTYILNWLIKFLSLSHTV